MTRKLISSGSTFEDAIGYSRAVVDGEWVFVSGTTGFDYSTMTIASGVLDQAEQCLKNIETALRQAGSGLADIVRVTYIVPNTADFSECWPVLRKYFGEIRPAATMISAGLADPRMKIEIEVTARQRQPNNIGDTMASKKQTAAVRKNIKKAAAAAKKKRTVAHLPKKTRTALGKEGAKAAKRKRQRAK